ncbi:hypothetical protein C8F04DRAFT_1272593 [Mycena alexandri]|uniref:Uncharacterized protein n=1 Tax=Mycena alexandri TaxID=1745969 RepID=A0AAD6S7B8_9AGAR|nr:hypothetical protein C8F04DRAFT_1272593 [Mycena alexandri]
MNPHNGGNSFGVTPVDVAVRHLAFLLLTIMSSFHAPQPSTSALTEYQLMQLKKQQQREKTRARMARYRQKMKELPEGEKEEILGRARAARARYRERNRVKLLDTAKCKHRAAFEAKYGAQAYEAKLEAQRQQQLEAHDRPRRRDRVKAAKKPKPPSQPPIPARRTNFKSIGAINDGDFGDFDSD